MQRTYSSTRPNNCNNGIVNQPGITPVMSYKQAERHMYGSSRLGLETTQTEMIGAVASGSTEFERVLGYKQFEMSEHRGNVISVVLDYKIPRDDNTDALVDYFRTLVNQKGSFTFKVAQYVEDDNGNITDAYGYFQMKIVNDRESWAGTYTVHDSIIGLPAATYTMQVASSTTINNRLQLVGDFQQVSGNTGIYIDITTPPNYQTINIPSQTFGSYTFSGTGSYTGGFSNFVINYNDGTNNRAQRWERQ